MNDLPAISQSSHLDVVLSIAEKELHEFYLSLPLDGVIVEAFTPEDAFNHLKPDRIDLILLDCGSETERGLTFLRGLKTLYSEIPVIFLTDDRSREVPIRAFRSGARDFIGKPADLFELQVSIWRILKIKRIAQEKRTPAIILEGDRKEKFTLGITTEHPANLLRAVRYIEENLAKKISLEELAKEAYLSKYHFCRVFAHHLGMPPMKFITLERIKRAIGYLKREEFNVSTVATEVGFNDLGAFIRQFKRQTGMTPTAYRNLPESSNSKQFSMGNTYQI